MDTLKELQAQHSILMYKYNRLNQQEAESPAGKMLAQSIKGVSRKLDALLKPYALKTRKDPAPAVPKKYTMHDIDF